MFLLRSVSAVSVALLLFLVAAFCLFDLSIAGSNYCRTPSQCDSSCGGCCRTVCNNNSQYEKLGVCYSGQVSSSKCGTGFSKVDLETEYDDRRRGTDVWYIWRSGNSYQKDMGFCKDASCLSSCPSTISLGSVSLIHRTVNNCATFNNGDCTLCTACNTGYTLCSGVCNLNGAVTLDPATCPSTTTIYANGYQKSTVSVTVSGPTGTATCGTAVQSCNVTLNSISTTNAMNYVACRTKDPVTNAQSTAVCPTFLVHIDKAVPVFTSCPTSPINVSPSGGNPGVLVSTTVTATDDTGSVTINCGAQQTVIGSGFLFPIGQTTVNCIATDRFANAATCTFSVINTDSTPPTITCPNNYAASPSGSSTVSLTAYTPNLNAQDNGGIVSATCTPAVSTLVPYAFPLGVTTVNCAAKDYGNNTASCSFSVTITDTIPPMVSCPSSLSYTTTASDARPDVLVDFLSSVTYSDAQSGIKSFVCPDSNTRRFMVTTTTIVNCTATDHANLASTCTFPLTIVDDANPVIVCPADVQVSPTSGVSTSATASFSSATATDNSGIKTGPTCTQSSPATVALGVTTVTCSTVDHANRDASCSFKINNTDTTKPTLTCSGFTTSSPLRVSPTVGQPYANVTWTFTAVDNSGIANFGCQPSGRNVNYDLGTNVDITCGATDKAGNTKNCVPFTLIVEDTTPPTISCPESINLKPFGQPSVAATFSYNVSDGSGIKSSSCSPPSGSAFSIGSTAVMCTAVDNADLQSSCTFNVNVNQNQPPVITCPTNQVYSTTGNSPSATATYAPTATDESGQAVSIACSPSSPSTFQLGSSTVTCVATNAFNLQSTCSFSVSIVDTTNPTITCPATIVRNPDTGKSFATVSYNAVSSDNSGIKSTSCSPASGFQFQGATTTKVTCTTTDNALLTSSCSFNVTVNDVVPPTIICPNDVAQSPLAGNTSAAADFAAPVVLDNVAVQSTTCSAQSGSVFSAGSTTVSCTATDTSGNTAQCTFVVFIGDVLAPTITCPASINTVTDAGDNVATVTWSAPSASDNSGVVSVACTNQPGTATFNVGSTTITCTATDGSTNSAACSFTVTVSDNEDPFVSCPSTISTPLDAGKSTKSISWDFNPTDNVGLASSGCTPASGSSFQFGTRSVSCSAVDFAGNSQSCTFNVVVSDTESPVVTCPAAYIGYTSPGASWGIVEWKPPSESDYSVYDNVGVDFVACSIALTEQNFTLGKTNVACTAKDYAGNTATCSFAITITDNEPPTITCPTSVTAEIAEGSPLLYAVVSFTALVAPTDNVGVASVRLLKAGVSIPVDTSLTNLQLPTGRTIYTYSATDAAGKSSFCTFSATVTRIGVEPDLTAPVIKCPTGTLSYTTDFGVDYAYVDWTDITASDDRGAPTVTLITNPPDLRDGSNFPVGISTVQAIALDAAGNQATCDFSVEVVDAEPPTVICPNSIIVKCKPPLNRLNISWTAPTIKDNVGILASTISRQPGEYAAGTYQVDVSAVDQANNPASCYFTFTIIPDTTPPTFTCPLSQTVNTDPGSSTALVSWDTVFPEDPSGIQSAVYTPNQYYPPANFPVGTRTVKFTATDNFLNSKECTFKIIVRDKEAPTVSCPESFSVPLPPKSLTVLVNWPQPDASDNVRVDRVVQDYQPELEYAVGEYNNFVRVYDGGNLTSFCNFTFVVFAPEEASSGASGAAASAAGGAAGGALLVLLVIILVFVLYTRRQREQMRKLEEQYGKVDMTDEAVLARAQAIQQALQNKKRNASPHMKWLSVPGIDFQTPPNTLAAMAAYLAQYSDRELQREHVVIESEIGAGEFGSVCSGYLRRPDGSKLTIAIKTCKDSSNDANKLKFLQEASIMIQFKHPKIVALVGVVTKSEPALICLEFCELGSLRSYLKSDIVFQKMSDADLIRMACDVCSAMHYLSESGFVHRDLAARNVLVNKDFVCKVCDFGLSQEAAAEGSQEAAAAAADEKIPIRWTAPEAVLHHQFSVLSDVWSFGILLWEMWSYGEMPYKGWPNDKVMAEVTKGFRMGNPQNCPTFMYGLMLDCWREDREERPSFSDIFERLLAGWNICKPISNYAASYQYDENGKRVPNSKKAAAEEDFEDDAYDLGGEGGKIAKPQIVAATENGEDEDDGMYDMGGVGGKIAKAEINEEAIDKYGFEDGDEEDTAQKTDFGSQEALELLGLSHNDGGFEKKNPNGYLDIMGSND